jgi:hypothetical protein
MMLTLAQNKFDRGAISVSPGTARTCAFTREQADVRLAPQYGWGIAQKRDDRRHSGAQLDLALSRPNVVHAALPAGPGGETFVARFVCLTRFRTELLPDAVSAYAPTDGA